MFGASGVDVTGASGGMGAGLNVASIDDFSFHCLAYRSGKDGENSGEDRRGRDRDGGWEEEAGAGAGALAFLAGTLGQSEGPKRSLWTGMDE